MMELDYDKIIATTGAFTKIKKITIPPTINQQNSEDIFYEVANLIDGLQNNENNIINGAYKFLYYAEIFDITYCKLTYIFSNALADKYSLSTIKYEVESGVDENSIAGIFDAQINQKLSLIAGKVQDYLPYNDDFLQKIAIKVIDHMHLNGADFTYSPTIARVTIIDASGTPINLDFEKKNGIYQATADLNGRFTIQLSTRDNL